MDLRRLLLATTVVTAITAVVGVVTAATGSGLTCEARWPLCDGAVFGLFPANLMSFIEWSHRLVAMITGFMILGSAAAVWRNGGRRRTLLAVLSALFLTPLQVVFGAFTVLVEEFVFGYSILVLTLHFGLASLILSLLIAATVWAYAETSPVSTTRIRQAGTAALFGFPIAVALTPRLFFVFGELAQLLYYGVGFGMFAALVVMTLWGRELGLRAVPTAGGLAGLLVIGQLVLARRAFGDAGQLAILGASFGAFGLTLAAVWRLRNLDSAPVAVPSTTDDRALD
jgi:cytochrome c oxidase assembly protein subunit 15